MILRMLNALADLLLLFEYPRKGLRYVSDRFDGFQYGSYGLKDEVALALSFIAKERGGVVIDGGANKGEWSKALLECETKLSQLIMIEPAPVHLQSLGLLVREYPGVVLETVAVGAEPDILPLFFDTEGSGIASLYMRDIRHIGVEMNESLTVPVDTLDAIAKKHHLIEIAFLKLDLEGHELEALKGARRLLSEKRVRALAFEFGGCNIDSRTFMKDFWSLLVHEHGFTMYRIAPRRRLIQLNHYSESLERFNWQNILACANGVKPTWKVVG
jgi:FkbM family methyltransferase